MTADIVGGGGLECGERLHVSRKVGTLSGISMNIKLLHFTAGIETVTGPHGHWALALDGRTRTFYGIDVAASGPIHLWLLALGPTSLRQGRVVEPCWLDRRSNPAVFTAGKNRGHLVVLPAPTKGAHLAALFYADRPRAQADALWGLTRDGELITALQAKWSSSCVRLSKGLRRKAATLP